MGYLHSLAKGRVSPSKCNCCSRLPGRRSCVPFAHNANYPSLSSSGPRCHGQVYMVVEDDCSLAAFASAIYDKLSSSRSQISRQKKALLVDYRTGKGYVEGGGDGDSEGGQGVYVELGM